MAYMYLYVMQVDPPLASCTLAMSFIHSYTFFTFSLHISQNFPVQHERKPSIWWYLVNASSNTLTWGPLSGILTDSVSSPSCSAGASAGDLWPIAYDPQRLLLKAIRSIRSSKCKQTSQLSPCDRVKNKVSAACCVPFSHSIVVFLHFSCCRWIMIKLIQAWFLSSYPESTASAATSLALLGAALPNIGHRGSPWGPPWTL